MAQSLISDEELQGNKRVRIFTVPCLLWAMEVALGIGQ